MLEDFYSSKVKEAINFLKDEYSVKNCEKESRDYPNLPDSFNQAFVGEIPSPSDDLDFSLIVGISSVFPDKLPRFYLTKEAFSRFNPIPHVDDKRFICTREEGKVFLREEECLDGLGKLINIATNIVERGAKGENTDNFVEEFSAYWGKGAEFKAFCLEEPEEKPQIYKILRLSSNLGGVSRIIAHSTVKGRSWISNLYSSISVESSRPIIYLPFPEPFIHIPRTNDDVLTLIEDKDSLKNKLDDYFNRDKTNLFVLFSVPINESRVYGSWKHEGWSSSTTDGFRETSTPVDIRFQRNPESEIYRGIVERVDKKRLFNRAGTGIPNYIEESSIAILGCGSVGSSLTDKISKSGLSNFLLVDKEKLKAENIPRHECGFDKIGKEKTLALEELLTSNFPHINCRRRDEDVLNMLQEIGDNLGEYDLIISAISNHAVERRLNAFQQNSNFSSPILFTWVEPYLVAGHALFIHPEAGGCRNCCFNGGEFEFSVSHPKNKIDNEREPGCQTTYTAYSEFDLDSFTEVVSRRVLDILNPDKRIETSCLYTWIGDLNSFEKQGYGIRPRWVTKSSYSLVETPIEKDVECNFCQSTERV